MLKPVSLLALDDAAASLAAAVQQRVAASCGLEDLVQWRAADDLAAAITSIHAQRQSPSSKLRTRDDIQSRELILLIVSAAGPDPVHVIDVAHDIRSLYEMRRLATFFSIEILCLLPDLFEAADYGAAYSLLKLLSASSDVKPFNEVWLLDSCNANRVKFGTLAQSLDTYADAIAGALTFEPELSGAIPGIYPRGMHPTFSSFGYAELVFPLNAALQRLEPRLAAELLSRVLLRCSEGEHVPASLRAKQFVAADTFAVPLSRIGVDAGQSLFKRFQPKTLVNEKTRNADELLAAVHNELKAHRDKTHLQNLELLAKQGEQTASDVAQQLTRGVDETLDRDDYASAIDWLHALVDPLPDLHAGAEVAPRNLITEINAATAALDARLRFVPNSAGSDASRKRIRELDNLLQDQKLVADTLNPVSAAGKLEEMEHERDALTKRLPEVLFAEESENNAARNSAREAEGVRLAEETAAREQHLRELFAQLPRAEQMLREALEMRRRWIWRQILWAILIGAGLYGIAFVLDRGVSWQPLIALALFAGYVVFRYVPDIAPAVRAAREALQRIREQIDVADKAKNAAYNDELQFEYDMVHRRTTLNVLRRTRELAKNTLDALRTRLGELEDLAQSFTPAAVTSAGLTINIIDDEDVDAWYERTAEDRLPFFREFPVSRPQSLHLPLAELTNAIAIYAASVFTAFRAFTLAQAASLAPEAKLAQRLKRFAESSAPLIELRDEDLQAQQAMQRDATLWMDASSQHFVTQVRRRLPDAHLKAPPDPRRGVVVTRILHYPGYVLGQIDYYRAQYEAGQHPESAAVPDLVPADLVLTGAVRTAYEQVLLGRACGVLHVREDGRLYRASTLLGESHLAVAQRLASSRELRQDLEQEIAPCISAGEETERGLRKLLDGNASPLDRTVIETLIARYGTALR